ncbi:recombinase family protein [Palleronia caenipelagi]|nr:recombinase family protein [Palleronia caenipelagi]
MSEYHECCDYVYIRTDPAPLDGTAPQKSLWKSDLAKTRAHLKKARNEGFTVHRRRTVIERVGPAVAASGRPKFVKLLRKLRPYTGLVVWHIDALGRDAGDILKTIRAVNARGAEVYCMAVSDDELSIAPGFEETMKELALLERSVDKWRRAADRSGRGVAGGRVGRPPSLDEAAQAKVRAGLQAGETVSDLARHHNTSRQTILRIRDAEK